MRDGFVGIDLGGTNIACAVADLEMNLVAEASTATESHLGPETVINRIGDLVEETCAEHKIKPLALGIGVPGLADIEKGETLFLPNLPTQWRNIEMGGPLSERLGCKVALLNDARMATLGELRFGAGRENVSTFVFFTLGTGIGGGIAVDGVLRKGPNGAAGELGHQTILPDGPLCGCGNRGCLETLASGTALMGKGAWLVKSGRAPILRELIDGDLNQLDPFCMARAAEEGDDAVREVILEAAAYLGIGVANLVATLYPDLIVLGGGVAKMGDILFDKVREVARERVQMFPTESIRIEPSVLGDQAGTWGGLALARELVNENDD